MAKTLLGRHRSLVFLACVLLFSLVLGSTVFADEDTNLGGSRFTIIYATARQAHFTIISSSGCDDTDENCTVVVTASTDIANAVDNPSNDDEVVWKEVFEDACASFITSASYGQENRQFEQCWESNPKGLTYDVEWPIIRPDAKFDIRPHCDDDDEDCAVRLGICYNPADCRITRASDTDNHSARIADFWNDAGSCLYDDDEDDVWDCINDEFQDWLDDELSSNDDYDDLIDELDRSRHDDLGLAVLGYDDDLNEVGREADDADDDPETRLERYQRLWRNTSPDNIYRDMDDIEEGSYSFRPTRTRYLTINVTNYLDYTSPIPVCNTSVGCFNLTGKSDVFRQYMNSFYVLIMDNAVMRCMEDAGWDTDDDHVIAFNNADLIACDERVETAVQHCPAENTGAKAVLFSLYDIGLLNGIVTQTYAQQLRYDVEHARVRTPSCLCAAGFAERDMIMSASQNDNPWSYPGARHPREVCDE